MPSDAPLSPPKPLPWSDQSLEHLCEVLRTTADEYGFSPRRADRYEAWILAFLSWCGEHAASDASPPTVDPCDIGRFREALRTRTSTTTDEVHEAMDALSFLFGAVAQADESLTMLPSGTMVGLGTSRQATKPPSSSDALHTLQVGWQKEASTSISNSDAPSSTAKAYLEQYQTQLEALHVSSSDAE